MQHLSSQPRRFGNFRYTATLSYLVVMLGLAGFLFADTPVASAQTPPNVRMSARSLFQGHFKFGDWLPVEVNLENFGKSIEVSVEAEITTRIGTSGYKTNFQRTISLNERANKKFILYVIPFVETANTSRSVVYNTTVYVKAKNQRLAESKVNLVPFNPVDYIVASVTQDPNALNDLTNLKLGQGQRSRVVNVNIPLNDIPDNAIGMRSIDALVLSEVNTEMLSNEQRATLREWIESGGQLFLMGGNSWGRVRAGLSATLLPLDVTNYTNLTSLDGLIMPDGEAPKYNNTLPRPVVLARGQVVKGARVLSYLQENATAIPMIVERKLGAGRIIATGVDLAVAPLTEWEGSTQIWQDLFNYNLTAFNQLYSENNPHIKTGTDMLSYVSNVPELRLPDILPFLALLGIYLLLVAPSNYILLKKFGRLELAWLTIPAFGALFTVLAIGYINTQPPGQVLINQLTVVQVGAEQETAQVRSYAAVFSPVEQNYDVHPGGDNADRVLISPLLRGSSSGNAELESSQTIVQGEQTRIEQLQIGQWNAQGFSLESSLPARNFQIISELQFSGDKIIGTIRNNTNTPLRNTLLALGDTVSRFKDNIEPGETVNVEFALPLPTAAVQAFCNSSSFTGSSSYVNTPSDRIANMLVQDRRDDKALLGKANFIRKVYESGRYNPVNTQRGFDLIGWMDNNPLPLGVEGITSQSKSTQVLLARLPVAFETKAGDTQVALPAFSFLPEIALNRTGQNMLTYRVDRTDQICVPPGGATVQMRLPVEPGAFKVKNINLYINSYNVQGRREPSLPDSFEMYDFQNKNWQMLKSITNSANQPLGGTNFFSPPPPVKNSIENADRYVDPITGKILVRMNNNSSSTVLFLQHSLEIEGAIK